MQFIFATDLHGRRELLDGLPEAGLLVLGGDLTHFGSTRDVALILDRVCDRYAAVLAVLGNCDPPVAVSLLRRQGVDIDLQVRVYEGVAFLGCGGSNTTPAQTPNEWEDGPRSEQLLAAAERLAPDLPMPPIVVSHAPPVGSGADRLMNGVLVGSLAVAALARRVAAPLVLCGHIHEARGVFDWDGRTVVNPGPLRLGGYAWVDLRPGSRPAVSLRQVR